MRNARTRAACGLLVLAAAVSTAAGAWALASKPHPLFGSSILGNSAELVSMWPTGVGGVDSLRVVDFNAVPDPDVLVRKAAGAVPGSPALAHYQQLDVATGDFDGDGRDDLVLAHGHATADPYTQNVSVEVASVDAATLGWGTQWELAVGATQVPPGSFGSEGVVRLAAGNFDADPPQEFVLARRTAGTIDLTLFELNASRFPVPRASISGPAQPNSLKESTRFDLAAGDFDGDGIDEIVLGGVSQRADNGHMQLFVRVYAWEAGGLVERASSTNGDQAQGNTALGQGVYFDRVAIATGHLRPQLQDQIVFTWNYRQAEWYEHVWGCGWLDNEWEFYYTTTPHLATLVVDTSAQPWTIGGWGVDEQWKSLFEQIASVNSCGDQYEPGYTSASLGLAVGDLTGDGLDEVAWAALGGVYVYQVAATAPYALTQRASVTRAMPYRDPARRIVEIADLDATAGGSEGWRAELALQDWGGSGSTQRIRVLRATTDGTGAVTGLAALCQQLDPQVAMERGDVALVAGDFNGDGIRLGEPTQHAITDAIQPTVVLGAPPVHFDVFGGLPCDITGCFPGDGSYACTDFKSQYSVETSVEFAVETEIRADWGLSTTLKGYAEGFGAKVEGTFGATYGQGFSRTAGQTHTYRASNTVSTSGGDRVLADVMSYDLWEYPVYGPGREVIGHVSVIEPGSVAPATQWFSFDSWAARSGSDAPAITHEPGNVLSYPKAVPVTGDYGDSWKADAVGWEVGNVGLANRAQADYAFDMAWSDIFGTSVAKSWNAGVEVGASISYEASDPMGELKAGVSAEVKGQYSASEVATHKVTVGRDIHLGATLGNLSGAYQAPYTVFPFVYRSATTGTLVLDYRVQPGGVGTWWDVYRGAPDLTFILPRLHRAAKGNPLFDPTTKDRSPDVRVYPGTAAVGETVQVRAIVRNFSLVDCAGPVAVRFRAQDPQGRSFPVQDVDGNTAFQLAGPIPTREGRPLTFRWIVPPYAADTLRIYAEADPLGAVAEVHEDNNQGYVEFYAVGGNPIDVPGTPLAGVPFRFEPGAPNPFHGGTRLAFGLPARTRVTLAVYDVAGRLVAKLADTEFGPGRHEVRWDGRVADGQRARPGVYLCRIVAGDFAETRRLVRLD